MNPASSASPPSPTRVRGLRWPSALTLLFVCGLAGCASATNPVAAVLGPRGISEEEEVRLGQQAVAEASRTIGLVADEPLQEYVQRVGRRLASESDRSELEWKFRVVDDPVPNAFGFPGGNVLVTRGLLGVVNSEAELAAVLAHEIGHVNARHGLQALVRQSGPEIGVWAVPVAELRALDGSRLALLFREIGSDAEREADNLAFRYMAAAGYDVREMPDVFAALGRIEAMGGRSALLPWLAIHRDPGQRVETIAQRAGGVAGDSLRQSRAEFLEQIEDLVYGQDPRQGLFRGSTFLHPDLAFRIDLPRGWQLRTLTQAVVATSPDRDAAIQLTILDQVGPAEAARRFVEQEGVRPTARVDEDVVNGKLLFTVPFRLATVGGSADGVAAWLTHGGRTYQIVGISTSADVDGHTALMRGVMRSFATLTDARLAELRPSRINIVRLGRATTFDDFNRRYPSVVDPEEVALLNRVAGGSTRLRAGGRMKRVVKG